MRVKLVIILAIALSGVILFWIADPFQMRYPRDEDLIRLFVGHREEFEELRRMVTEDSPHGSYFTHSNIREITRDVLRQKEYQRLFSEIRPSLTVTIDKDDVVRFIFAGGGLSAIGPGWLKGIEYIPGDFERVGTLVESLDEKKLLPAGVDLRQIEPKWFLVYQRTDD